MNELVINVERWAEERGLTSADPIKQLAKLMEEVGELAEGLVKDKKDLTLDGIGDAVVVLIILARQIDSSLEECLQIAYSEIKNRKGKTVKGVFVKQEDLDEVKRNERD